MVRWLVLSFFWACVCCFSVSNKAQASCGVYPVGIDDNDRVLSFLADGGDFKDQPFSAAGTSSEGMLVFEREAHKWHFCNGNHWEALVGEPVNTSASPRLAAAWGSNTSGKLGNPEVTDLIITSPVRLSDSPNFAATDWKVVSVGD